MNIHNSPSRFREVRCNSQSSQSRSAHTPRNYVNIHDDVIKWKLFPRYWPFVRRVHRSPVNFPHKGQWRGALMFSLICVLINGWDAIAPIMTSCHVCQKCEVLNPIFHFSWACFIKDVPLILTKQPLESSDGLNNLGSSSLLKYINNGVYQSRLQMSLYTLSSY